METSKQNNRLSDFGDPLLERYVSDDMLAIFAKQNRYQTWRKIWLALAESQQQLGLPIQESQLTSIRSALQQEIDFARVAEIEEETQHDVMAHLHAFAEQCKEAKPILHLGATSAFVTDNADGLLMLDGMKLLLKRTQSVAKKLGAFCDKYKSLPCVGYTHFQVAMPTTVGRRGAYWLQDLMIDGHELHRMVQTFKIRGAKGTTGTQASYFKLFDGDHQKVRQLDQLVAERLQVAGTFTLTGQVYPRKYDSQILAMLCGIGESASKMAVDLRLWQHLREVEEPFAKKQVGSSAMPFKRNPVMAERVCSLSRLLFAMYQTSTSTSSVQWMERSLDDSAVRRLSIPRAFMVADALLVLYERIVDGLNVHEQVVERHLNEQLPFLMTEMLLMEGVKSGSDRQELHEKIRNYSMAAFQRVQAGEDNNLLEELRKEKIFAPLLEKASQEKWQSRFLTGRAPAQVDDLIQTELKPFLNLRSS